MSPWGQGWKTNLREGTVVPEITFVGETVSDETKLALLDILLNGVEKLFLGDLNDVVSVSA